MQEKFLEAISKMVDPSLPSSVPRLATSRKGARDFFGASSELFLKPLLVSFKKLNVLKASLLIVFLVFFTLNVFAENAPSITSYCSNSSDSQDRVCSAYNVNSKDFVQITVALCLGAAKELSHVAIVTTNIQGVSSPSVIKGAMKPDAHRNLNFIPSQSTWINKILFTNDYDEAYVSIEKAEANTASTASVTPHVEMETYTLYCQ